MKSFRALLVVFSLASAVTFGQANQGSITGTVHDQTGAVVAGAPIEAKNSATGVVITGGATETGNFVIPVPVGTYEMTVSVTGFKKFVQTGIPVVEGQATRRDVQLEIGQQTEVVTVTDTQPLLKTEGGDVSYRVTSQLANQLPVLPLGGAAGLGNIRSPLFMTTLLPGVQYSPAGFNGVVFQTLTINGLPANSQTWTIEGQDATPTLWRGVTSDRGQGGVDAIEAMTVQTSNFAAEYGKAGGAAINYTMKSGTNAFHGSVYNYFVNEFLHAGTPYTDWVNQSTAANNFRYNYKAGEHIRNTQRRNDFGGTIGGPVIIPKLYNGRDKTFFFFNFEQFRENINTATGIVTVPTTAYRNGDFSAAGCTDFDPVGLTCRTRPAITMPQAGCIPGPGVVCPQVPAIDSAGNAILNGAIYDPATYAVVDGFPTRTLYPNQRIPLTSFDRVSNNIQNMFPLATNNNLQNNFNVPAYDTYRHTTIPSIKIDQNIGSTLRISGYWGQTITNQNNTGNQGFSAYPWSSTQLNKWHNHTIRINADKTITPTLILHAGIGYFWQQEPNQATQYDQSGIGLPGPGAVNAYPAPTVFPTIVTPLGAFGPLLSPTSGGFSPGIGASFDAIAWEQKPTANLNLTWVKGNHTLKFGGDTTIQGYITKNKWRANGNFSFNAAQTGNPYEASGATTLSQVNPTGFLYASFLLGQPNSLELAQQTQTKLGGHAFAFFVQDNWKVSPKLTIEYGLRYDYQTYLSEQYGRHASASFSTFNPSVGRFGGLAYEGGGPCHCKLSSNYPYAFGPRVNLSYQVLPKTVLRAGFGVNYNVVQTPAGNNFSVGDFYQIFAPGYGITPLSLGLQGGNVFYPGNPYGNTEVVWPTFDPGRIPPVNGGFRAPVSPFSMYHPNSRPGRILQWSIGLQHEIVRNLVVEASYVGNRGAWFYSPLLDTQAMNSLGDGQLGRYSMDIHSGTDRDLLGQNILVNGAFNPAAAAKGIIMPYSSFPPNQQVGQAIRPYPQWQTTNPYLGPFRGNTWYDSLQLQVTKRYSHNIDMSMNFTFAHANVLGASSDTDFFLAGRPQVTDPFNRDINKQLNQLVPPLKTVISGTYTTPGLGDGKGWDRYASIALRDWQIGVVLQYQSGQLLTVPNSNNNLTTQLRLTAPAFGPAFNPWNFIPGSQFFKTGFDPNGGFDPRQYNAASPTDPKVASYLSGGIQTTGACLSTNCSWTNPAPGDWGVTAPYIEGYRWRRRPDERFNFGRNFRFGKENRYVLNIRAEFSNILNRLFFNAPTTGNPFTPVSTTTQNGLVFPTGGYGVVSTLNGAGSAPRQGTLVGRLTF